MKPRNIEWPNSECYTKSNSLCGLLLYHGIICGGQVVELPETDNEIYENLPIFRMLRL